MPAIKLKNKISFADIIRRAVLSWLLAATVEYMLLPAGMKYLGSLDGLAEMSFARFIAIAAVAFVLLCVLAQFMQTSRAERWAIAAIFALLAAVTMLSSYFFFFLGICAAIILLFAVYGIWGWNGKSDIKVTAPKAKPAYVCVTAAAALLFVVVISRWSIQRMYVFQSQTYDFGIFSQMFYYMKETGRQLTTLERDGLLSHFAVHVSPIYYLLLPFYIIIPRAETLDVLQALVLASSVIPMWKICRLHGMKDMHAMLFCLLLLLYPSLSGGTSLDIHENCFLTPLLLWLLYGIDKGNITIISVSAFLTLMVKEDAAVYVAIIALWLILKAALRKEKKREIITGILLLAAALIWFVLATNYLATKGTGVMTDRYENFFYEENSSLITVIKACLLQPLRLIYECVGDGKRMYIIYTLAPLLGLPFITRKYERFILLIPYILINLMSDYAYQHDVFQQNGFGSLACLFYLSVVNFSELDIRRFKLPVLALALVIGTTSFALNPGKHIKAFDEAYKGYKPWFDGTREDLELIPEDASVAASPAFAVMLSEREVIYDIYYTTEEHLFSTDYVAICTWDYMQGLRYKTETQSDEEVLSEMLESRGYSLVLESANGVLIWKKP